MKINFKHVDNYKTFNRKDEIIALLVENELEFVPSLSNWRDGNTPYDKLRKYILPNDSLIIAIDIEKDTIIGFFHLKIDYPVPEIDNVMSNLKIETIIISPSFRNKGIATTMYTETENLNKNILKKPYIISSTWESNETQHHLYKKLGYNLENISSYPQDENLKRYFYVKKINL